MSKKKPNNDTEMPTTSEDHFNSTNNPRIRVPLSVKKKTNALKNDTQVNLDEMVCKFFAKTGLSSDTVRDPSFIQLIYMLNKDYSPPTPSTVDYELGMITTKLKAEKKATDLNKFVQPVSITVDTIKQGHDVFLAFSLHYLLDNGPRKNVVSLCKMNTLDIDPVMILDKVQLAANEFCAKKIRFPSLVTKDDVVTKYFHEVNIIDRSYVCYFTYITRFAEALLRIPEFEVALDVLKNFFLGVKMDNEFQYRIGKYFVSNKVIFELPNVEHDKWTDISDFLSNVLQYHRWMADLSLRSMNHKAYIDERLYEQLMCLQTILSHLNQSARELSKSDSHMSQVLPEIEKIRKLITTDLTDGVLRDKIETEFSHYLDPITDHSFNDGAYVLATYLDPRFCHDPEIYSSSTWDVISEFVRGYLMTSNFGGLMSKRDKKSKIEVEVYNYQCMVKKQRPTVNPFNWWKIYCKRFALLYEATKVFVISPPCAIDGEQYFGRRGKFIINDSKMTLKQFNNTLAVASSLETFRGRGYTDKHIALEQIAIDQGSLVNVVKQIKAPVIKKKKPTTPEQVPTTSNARPVTYTQTLMLQPTYPSMVDNHPPYNHIKHEPVYPVKQVVDYSHYYMQRPEVKEEPIDIDTCPLLSEDVKPEIVHFPPILAEVKPEPMLGIEVKPEPIEVTEVMTSPQSTSAPAPAPKQKSPYVSTLPDEKGYSLRSEEIITRPPDRHVFIKVPYQRKAMERVLERSANEPTFVSIDYVGATANRPPANSKKRPYELQKPGPSAAVVTEANKRYKRICTNFETDQGVIRKERIYPFSTPTSLDSITIARPQNIRSTPNGSIVRLAAPKVENGLPVYNQSAMSVQPKMEEINVKVES